MVLTRLPRVQTLHNPTPDGLHARHVTRLLQNNCLKDDEAIGIPLPLANAPQLLVQHQHKPPTHLYPWGFIALHEHYKEVTPLGLPDRVVHYPPTEVATIIGMHPVSVDLSEADFLWFQSLPGQISFQSLPVFTLSGVSSPVLWGHFLVGITWVIINIGLVSFVPVPATWWPLAPQFPVWPIPRVPPFWFPRIFSLSRNEERSCYNILVIDSLCNSILPCGRCSTFSCRSKYYCIDIRHFPSDSLVALGLRCDLRSCPPPPHIDSATSFMIGASIHRSLHLRFPASLFDWGSTTMRFCTLYWSFHWILWSAVFSRNFCCGPPPRPLH